MLDAALQRSAGVAKNSLLHAGFSQGATAAAILLSDLARSRPELLPAFCILVRGAGLCDLLSLRVDEQLVAHFLSDCTLVSI